MRCCRKIINFGRVTVSPLHPTSLGMIILLEQHNKHRVVYSLHIENITYNRHHDTRGQGDLHGLSGIVFVIS